MPKRRSLLSWLSKQMYKVGSATRCDSDDNCWAMDLAMPWYVPEGHWHDYHWDLNVQMSYWLVLPSNHGQLGKSLTKMMARNIPYLAASVPPAYQNDSAALSANTGMIARASCQAFLVKPGDESARLKEPIDLADTIVVVAPELVSPPVMSQEAVVLLTLNRSAHLSPLLAKCVKKRGRHPGKNKGHPNDEE